MMLRINLLPVRQGKRREAGRQILVVIAGVLFEDQEKIKKKGLNSERESPKGGDT